MKTNDLRSLEMLESTGRCWDDLWKHSGFAFPSTQAALIAQWTRHFACTHPFHAIGIEADGQWQAALPLVLRRSLGCLRVAELPGNEWSPVGNLLVRDTDDQDEAVAALVAALDHVPYTLLRLEPIRLDAPQWQSFCHSLDDVQRPYCVERLFDVGHVNVQGNWDDYFASRSRNLRKDLGKAWRRLEKLGTLTTKLHFEPNDQRLKELMQQGFEVEDRSWKGRSGTSVLKTPDMFDFYCSQAALLRDRGQLQLSTLELDGQPIAFEYGWRSDATYFSFKVGYDESYERHSPGQLLRMKLLEHFFADDEIGTVDFFGPLNSALAAWATEAIPIGRIVAGTPTLLGRTCVQAYQLARRLQRRLRKKNQSTQYALRPFEGEADCRSGLALTKS